MVERLVTSTLACVLAFAQAEAVAQTGADPAELKRQSDALRDLVGRDWEAERIKADNRRYALMAWHAAVHAHVKSKVVMPHDAPVSAQAEFYVALLPSGQVDYVRLASSSGHKAFNTAVEQAIKAASPLPQVRPDMPFPDHVYVKLQP